MFHPGLERQSLLSHGIGQKEQAQQIGHGHHSVEKVGEAPHQMQRLHGPGKSRETKHRPVQLQVPDAEEVFKGLFPKILPAQDGGKGKEGHSNAREHRSAPAQHRFKGQDGQMGAGERRSGDGIRGTQDARGADAKTMVSKKVPVMLM